MKINRILKRTKIESINIRVIILLLFASSLVNNFREVLNNHDVILVNPKNFSIQKPKKKCLRANIICLWCGYHIESNLNTNLTKKRDRELKPINCVENYLLKPVFSVRRSHYSVWKKKGFLNWRRHSARRLFSLLAKRIVVATFFYVIAFSFEWNTSDGFRFYFI